jgi:hypothetical protein
MFKCPITKKTSRPGEKPVRVIVERRDREYKNDDGQVIGRGWEIVKEIFVSEEALERHPELKAGMY